VIVADSFMGKAMNEEGDMARKRRSNAASPPEVTPEAAPPEHRPVVPPDSPLAVTARELLAAHTPPEGEELCPRCQEPDPCPTARHASIVCLATV
jgi:hypothetical protein